MTAAAASEDLSPLATKCMEFCQALASQGKTFSFNLTTGPEFSFSLDTRGSGKPTSDMAEQVKKRKKLSSSDIRRNKRRHQEFLRRKSEGRKDEGVVVLPSPEKECLPSPEKERAPHHIDELQLTPVHGERNEEDTLSSSLPSPPPALTVLCDLPRNRYLGKKPICGKTFTSDDDFRCHVHEDHSCCNQRYPTPCPWRWCGVVPHNDVLK